MLISLYSLIIPCSSPASFPFCALSFSPFPSLIVGKLIAVDQRLTLKEFKQKVVAPLLGLDDRNFKIFKPTYYYADKTPVEVTLLSGERMYGENGEKEKACARVCVCVCAP